MGFNNTNGGQFAIPRYDMGADHNGLEAYRQESDASTKDYNSTQTTSTDGEVNQQSVTRNFRGRADVPMQRFIATQRSADASPYIQALGGDVASGFADPTKSMQSALRNARTQAFVRLAGNLGRMASSDADGVTGVISKDTQSPTYLTSYKSYQNAIPSYNKALATAKAANDKAKADLMKTEMLVRQRYDTTDANNATKTEYGNTKNLFKENQAFAEGNKYRVTDNSKNFNKNSTTVRNDHSQSVDGKNVWMNSDAIGKGNKRTNALMGEIPYPVNSKDGRIIQGTLNMGKNDFRHLLYAIERNAMENEGDGKKWLKDIGMSDRDANGLINAMNKEFNDFYTNNTKKGSQTYGDVKQVSAADLDDEHLNRLWSGMAKTFSHYGNLSALRPYMAFAQFTDDNGKKYKWGNYFNSGNLQQSRPKPIDYAPINKIQN